MKKVLQISNYYYPNIGGIEQVARDISNALRERDDYQVKVICFNEDSADGDHVCHRGETIHDYVDGVEVIKCGCFTKVASQSLSMTFGRELKKVMNSYKPDIVIFHYPNPFQAAFLRAYLNRDFQFVLYWHLDIVKQKVLGKLFNGQSNALLKRANHIIATSPLYIEGSLFLSRFQEKCQVVPNCISESRMALTPEILERAQEIRQENEGKIICFGVGRHIPYKGFKYLVEASKYLDDQFRIFIGGKGELTEELKKQADGDRKITFLGRVSNEDLIAFYVAMDIFCFPSITKNEAFGIALAEGMYFEKPAVTFTIPGSGVNYVNLSEVTGIEVENRNVEAYAAAIKMLAEDQALRKKMGVAAKKRVEEFFLSTRFEKNILELLDNL